MDWMSQRLMNLIQEGQKALGKEVVVMGDDAEAEDGGFVDDGADGWADEDNSFVPGAEPTRSPRRTPRTLGRSPTPTSFFHQKSSSGPVRSHSYADFRR
jgi:hypothetical protein